MFNNNLVDKFLQKQENCQFRLKWFFDRQMNEYFTNEEYKKLFDAPSAKAKEDEDYFNSLKESSLTKCQSPKNEENVFFGYLSHQRKASLQNFEESRKEIKEYLTFPLNLRTFKTIITYLSPLQLIYYKKTVSNVRRLNFSIKKHCLSCSITESEVVHNETQTLKEGCIVSLSQCIRNMRRNIFMFTKKNCKTDDKVYFNDIVRIQLFSSGSRIRKLFIRCVPTLVQEEQQYSEEEDLQEAVLEKTSNPDEASNFVCLTEEPDAYCDFQIVPCIKDMKPENFVQILQLSDLFSLLNVMTNQYLTPNKEVITSLLGMENTVSCRECKKNFCFDRNWSVCLRPSMEESSILNNGQI